MLGRERGVDVSRGRPRPRAGSLTDARSTTRESRREMSDEDDGFVFNAAFTFDASDEEDEKDEEDEEDEEVEEQGERRVAA